MFTNGSTAIDGRSCAGSGAAWATTRLPLATPDSLSRRTSSSSLRTSFAVWKRRSGSFSRQRLMTRSTSRGRSSLKLSAGGGVSRRIAELISAAVVPVNGRRPVASS